MTVYLYNEKSIVCPHCKEEIEVPFNKWTLPLIDEFIIDIEGLYAFEYGEVYWIDDLKKKWTKRREEMSK